MPVSAIDSLLFRNLFGTAELRIIFDDKTYRQRCVDVETALARAQSKVGVIPEHVGERIMEACSTAELDYDRLSNETEIVGYPILPLVRQLTTACGDDAGKYVYWGATTQDIQDTAAVLQMKDGMVIVEQRLRSIIGTLTELAKGHRDTPMAGRTYLQHALPITLGHKCAVYLSGFLRHLERLQQLKPCCLLVQFGGAAGTLASLGSDDEGLRVHKALAEELGLHNATITWHTARDGIAEIIDLLALIGGSLGKLATDFIVMSSNESSEISEPFRDHAASKILRANAGLCLDAMNTDFERASGPWHLEWLAVPESFVVVVGALSQADFTLSGLVVNVLQMERNLNSTRGLIVAEAVMMESAIHIGRQNAHDIVYGACKVTIEAGEETYLFDMLVKDETVTEAISQARLAELCSPANYLGAAGRMVDDVLASHVPT